MPWFLNTTSAWLCFCEICFSCALWFLKFLNLFFVNSKRIYVVVGSRRPSNAILSLACFFASLGFLFNGAFLAPTDQTPGRLLSCFYGLTCAGFCVYLAFLMVLNVGGGWNIFDTEKQNVRLFRWGFPGKNRRVDLNYGLNHVNSLVWDQTASKQPGGSQAMFLGLDLTDQREIPFCSIRGSKWEQTERLVSDLGQFLNRPVKFKNAAVFNADQEK